MTHTVSALLRYVTVWKSERGGARKRVSGYPEAVGALWPRPASILRKSEFLKFSDREIFKNHIFVSEISSKRMISCAPALLAHVGLGKRKVGAETRRGAFPGRPRQWEHCGRDVHRF